MTTPYVGEIRIFGFARIPTGWFACAGQLLSISQYETLYTILGTTYGGDGTTTFGLPDLRGQAPMHNGTGQGLTPRVAGQRFGTEGVTLNSTQMPAHSHPFVVSQADGSSATPGPTLMLGSVANNPTPDTMYYSPNPSPAPTADVLANSAVGSAGNSQPHDNCMPSLTLSICIAWTGIFPSQN